KPGTGSPETASGSAPGWMSTCTASPSTRARSLAHADLHGGRDDDCDRGAVPAERDDLLRGYRPAQRGGQPGPGDACTGSRADLRVRNDRLEAGSGAALDR